MLPQIPNSRRSWFSGSLHRSTPLSRVLILLSGFYHMCSWLTDTYLFMLESQGHLSISLPPANQSTFKSRSIRSTDRDFCLWQKSRYAGLRRSFRALRPLPHTPGLPPIVWELLRLGGRGTRYLPIPSNCQLERL